ncbi:hypothetical protein [Ectobacillus funiculus]|uniref:hypothetical protein n=1 Tax=Ectobacillus funiculus TaxID=137993 RepID=UPI0013ECC149|nr:hypothetical protein [Ectobacillus funiculus]
MNKCKCIFLIVIDSVSIGDAPDLKKYGDEGAAKFDYAVEHMNGLYFTRRI